VPEPQPWSAPSPPMKLRHHAALPLVGLLSFASRAPAATPAATTEEVVSLSPFQVSVDRDAGYRATNTLDGSRLNTPLRDTPGAISVFTRDFLDDIGATDLRDILKYDVNTEENYGDAQSGSSGTESNTLNYGLLWRTRGMRSSTSINGFRAGVGGSDTYNVERVGATRGPNAILFGTGAPGGILNFRTKSANVSRNTNQLEARVGENESYRGSFDFNRSVVKHQLGLRLMGVHDRKGSHMPYQSLQKKSATLAAEWRFRKSSALSTSYEHLRIQGAASRPYGPLDGISRFLDALGRGEVVWNVARERYETRDGAAAGASVGVGTVSNRTVLVYAPQLGPPVLWEGASSGVNRATLSTAGSRHTSAVTPIAPETLAPLGRVTATGPSEYGTVDFHSFTATVTHPLSRRLHLELAVNQSSRHSRQKLAGDPELAADLSYRLPDGSLNPYFFGQGYYYMQSAFLRQKTSDENLTARASLSYEHDLGQRWGQHRFAAMSERNIANFRRDRLREVWAGRPYGGTAVSAPNQISRRRYIKIGSPWDYYTTGFPSEPFATESFTSAFASVGTLTTATAPANALDVDDETTTDSHLLVVQNYLFNRRLVTTLGLRHDTVVIFSPKTLTDTATQAFRLASAADQPIFATTGTNWFDRTVDRGWRRSFGGVFHATSILSLTANHATGIELPDRSRTVLPTEEAPSPYKGSTLDFGVAASLLDNRISGSVKYFKTDMIGEQANGRVTTAFVQPNNEVMASFEYYFRQAGLVTLGSGDPIRSIDELRSNYFSAAGAYLFDRRSDGVEVETIANPTPNWSFRASYSRSEIAKTNVLKEGEPWWAERVALWQTLDRIYTTRTGRPSILSQLYVNTNNVVNTRTVAARIADSERELAAIRREEERGYGNRKHKASVWGRHSVTQGWLKGLAIGGGWRFQGKNMAGFDLATGTPLYGNNRSLLDLLVQYRTKGLFGFHPEKTTVTYQLNVTNLLDDDSLYITGMAADTVTGEHFVRRAFREEPRNAALTVRLEF